MVRIVQKFGGTSVADIARLEMVSLKIKREVDAGHQVAVVVSAMAGVTNQLVGYAQALAGGMQTSEYDAVAAAGEQVTSGLLALALNQIGLQAQSFLAWQIPIITDNAYGGAKIHKIDPQLLEACLAKGIIPVVAGFQGVTSEGRLTTLGRGGSDTTAVALAAALKAERCDIYTDVKGVFTADPRIVPKARMLKSITYEEMFELSAQGAKVLQKGSVETAMGQGVKVRVLSSFHEESGTEIGGTRIESGSPHPTGITHSGEEARLTLKKVRQATQALGNIFEIFTLADIYIDMIVQTISLEGFIDLTFTVLKREIPRALDILSQKDKFVYNDLILDPNIAKITIVGGDLQTHPQLSDLMFKTLTNAGIPPQLISCSPIKVSVLVNEAHVEEGVRVLHAAFEMDKEL